MNDFNHYFIETSKTELAYQEGCVAQCIKCGKYFSVVTLTRMMYNPNHLAHHCKLDNPAYVGNQKETS